MELIEQDAKTSIAREPPVGVCLAFGVGTVGTAILLNTVTVYLPAFMATVLGRSVATAGLLLTLSKLYDVLCDVVIGLASDRTRSRFGRRKPYMLAGALIGSLAFVTIFNPPIVDGPALLLKIGLLLVIYSTGYSLFNVPYLAMPPDIAVSYHGRTRLFSFRTVFVSIGQLAALSGTGWLLAAFWTEGATPGRVWLLSVVCCLWGDRFLNRLGRNLGNICGFRRGLLGAVPGGAQIAEHQRIMTFENQVVFRTDGGVRRLVNLAELLDDPALAPINGRGWQADDVTGRARLVPTAAWTTAPPLSAAFPVPAVHVELRRGARLRLGRTRCLSHEGLLLSQGGTLI